MWTRFGTSWLRLSMPGTCTCRMSLKKSPSLRIMVLGQVQPQRLLFVVQVDQVLHVVLRAPLRLHPEEGLAEHPAPHVPVVRLRAPGFVGHLRREQKRQVWLEVVALLLPELVQQLGRPRHEAGIVGFVAEEAQNGLAELVPDRLLVGFVRDLEEGAGGIRIQVVDQRILAVFGTRAVGPVRMRVGELRKICRTRISSHGFG